MECERAGLRAEVERLSGKLEDVRDKLAEAQAQQRQGHERADRAEAAAQMAQASLAAQRGDMGELSRSKVSRKRPSNLQIL